MNKLNMALTALCIIALAAFSYYLYVNIEKVTEVKELRLKSKTVKKNPYLALEYFLKKTHKTVSYSYTDSVIEALSSRNNSIVFIGPRHKQTPKKNDALLHWVNQGGHIIVEAYSLWDPKTQRSDDALLDQLGIQLSTNKAHGADTTVLITFPEEPHRPTASLNISTNYHLTDTQKRAYNAITTKSQTIPILQIRHGQGKITVLASTAFWKNKAIGKHDHAWFLNMLNKTHVTLNITHKGLPMERNLMQALIQNYGSSLTIGALLLMIILWHKGMRSGPLEHTVSRDRRRLPEYLNALAHFSLKTSGDHALINTLQQDIILRVQQRHTQYHLLSQDKQWQILARLTQTSPQTLVTLMTPSAPDAKLAKIQLIKTILALQTIRNKL